MKPKNKIQRKVVELSAQLPTISERQKEWALLHCVPHIAKRTKKGACTCLDCGKRWTEQNKKNKTTCPHCGRELHIVESRQRVFEHTAYFCMVTTFQGWQVLRYFYVHSTQRQGKQAHYFCSEVVQRWINPQGKYVLLEMS